MAAGKNYFRGSQGYQDEVVIVPYNSLCREFLQNLLHGFSPEFPRRIS